MELSVNAAHFCGRADGTKRELKTVLQLCRAAGFRAVDLRVPPEQTEDTAAYLAQIGLTVNQSHCPYNRYAKKDYADFAADILTAAKAAAALGSKIFVVHGDEFDFTAQPYSREAALEFNYRLFSPAAEFLEQNGMRLAFENVFPDMDVPRFCSLPEELAALTDKFPRETVGICWDTGHGKVANEKEYLSDMASLADRFIATHIHDNYYGKDLHLFPFLGQLNWEGTVNVLKNAGYAGEFTYEFVYDRIPDAFLPDVLSLLYRMGEYLLKL